MYIILSYDVDAKNCSKLMKILRKYVYHIHNSVFEGEITDVQLKKLKEEVKKVLSETDRMVIYELPSEKALKKDIFGKYNNQTIII